MQMEGPMICRVISIFALICLAVPAAQASPLRPTTRLVPCGDTCKLVRCRSLCTNRAQIACRSASPSSLDGCLNHVERTCQPNCIRNYFELQEQFRLLR
jgi:hypothetical protein